MKYSPKAMPELTGGNIIVAKTEWKELVDAHNSACDKITALEKTCAQLSEQLHLKSEELKTLAKIVKEIYTDET